MKYILALDQGTTSSRSILFDHSGQMVAVSQQEFTQHFPKPGWVEHDPNEIWQSQLNTIHEALDQANCTMSDVVAIGITNQRETTVVWNRQTGVPVYNAIVWQDRRTAGFCETLKSEGLADQIRSTTGLVIDAYFSGTKLHWILNNVEHAQQLAEQGDLMFGTIDSWLIYKLTGGKVHATDYSNVSRTMLYDIRNCKWDEHLLDRMKIPRSVLPKVQSSSSHFGNLDKNQFGTETPIMGVGGDQQAALFGQLCHSPGDVKNTYGTGCFMLMHTGDRAVESRSGLLTTMACNLDDQPLYALEGSVFVAGAVIQWLRDGLSIIEDSKESERLALSVDDNGGVYFVPAFTGLGTPHWDMYARGSIFGLTRGTQRAHIVRAALESIALQSSELLTTMHKDSGFKITTMRVDGGASNNNFLMQFQADLIQTKVERPVNTESTAVGAAYLAGLKSGFWSLEQIRSNWALDVMFESGMNETTRDEILKKWERAVERAKHWELTD